MDGGREGGGIMLTLNCVLLMPNATHNLGIPVVLKGDLLMWYSFCHTSAFSVPS